MVQQAEYVKYSKLIKEKYEEKNNVCSYVGVKGKNKTLFCSKRCMENYCLEHKSKQKLISPQTVLDSPNNLGDETSSETDNDVNDFVISSPTNSPEPSVEVEDSSGSDSDNILDSFTPKVLSVSKQWLSKEEYCKEPKNCTFVKDNKICYCENINTNAEEKDRRCKEHIKNKTSNK